MIKRLMCCTVWVVLIACIGAVSAAYAEKEARSISFADISADGQTVFFSSWGDIWSAPRDGSSPARRLTDNVAYDARPMVSPDGSKLAFLSDRFGNFDIFVMPVAGGAATRLTWDDTTNYPYDWNADGTAVLEYARRQDMWALSAYEVPLDGGQPVRLSGPDHDDHVFASYLGDGEHLVYTRGPGDWSRKHYLGQENYDLWLFNVESGEHEQLTEYRGKDCWPQPSPDGSIVYFVSSRDGTENLWAHELATGEQWQLTSFETDGPRWPRISSDGDEIVFERMGFLWVVSTDCGDPQRLNITFSGDPKHEMELDFTTRGNVSEYAISPNGRYYAAIVFGDLYILKNPESYEEEPDQDLSRAHRVVDNPGREMHVAWHPEGTQVCYISDRDGQFDVFSLDLVSLEESRITESAEEEWYPRFAPKGDNLSFYRGHRELWLHDMNDDSQTLLVEGHLYNGPWAMGYEWAPDGYWMTVNMATIDWRSDVYLLNIDERKPLNISRTPDWDNGGTWSADGKHLAWTHGGESGAEIMLLELNPEAETYDTGLLFEEDMPEPEAEAAEETESDPAELPDEENSDEEVSEEADEHLTIDMDRIHLRAKPITSMQGEAFDCWFAPDSSYLIFQSDHDGNLSWWSATIDGFDYSRLAEGMGNEMPQWSPDSKKLHFLNFGNITYLSMGGPQATGGGMVAISSHVSLDQHEIWNQMLFEGWRHLRDGFYDPDMHGRDWDGVLARYQRRVNFLGTDYEFSRLYREMLGELGASHLGFYNGNTDAEAPPETTASFGTWFADEHTGEGWLVDRVITNGPADRPGSRLYPGDLITELNGEPVDDGVNRSKLLRNKSGQILELTVRSGEIALAELSTDEAERSVVIKPVPAAVLRQLNYLDWVEDNRQSVYRMSDGRIAYQHIQGMDGFNLEKFRRELFTESREKDAIIIDVRFNGGGGISENLVDILDRKPFANERIRDGVMGVQPALLWDKPVVVLINAHSFSDAEYFPHIMKELGLGTVIGETTGGNVIGTYDFPLMDGSMLRMPAWGIWLLDGTNMEGNGAEPDIFVHIDPEVVAEGGDNQLAESVDYLLKQI